MTTTRTATPEALVFFERIEEIMCELYGRWQDEKDYEDINDYSKPLEGAAKVSKVKILGMTKKPFGVRYSVGEKEFHAFIKGGRTYRYNRTK
jgi:hypothetical protein